VNGSAWDGPPVPVRPPFERLDQGPALRGRQRLLDELARVLGDPEAGPRVRVLHGLGGVGKTSVALATARHAKSCGLPVWWIWGTSTGAVTQGLRSVAVELGASPETLGARHAADALWELLEGQAGGWLLVMDEIDAPSGILGEGNAVTDGAGLLRPVQGAGLVLVTTRDGSTTTWGDQGSSWCRLHRLEPLARQDGAQVLMEATGPDAGGQHEAGALAARLGGLPLALQLAGRSLAEAGRVPVPWNDAEIRTFRQYQAELDGPGFSDLLGPIDEEAELDERQARVLVGRTWELSLDLLERDIPRARPLLRLLCCFDRAPLAYEAVLDPGFLAQTNLFRGITAKQLLQAVDALAGLDLISRSNDDDGLRRLSLHPLVRDVGRMYVLREQPRIFSEYVEAVTCLLLRAMGRMPDDQEPAAWPGWRFLAPHCVSALRLLDDVGATVVATPGDWDPTELLIPAKRAMDFFTKRGRYQEPEREIAETLLRWQRLLAGELAEETLRTEADLAELQRRGGDYANAEKTYEKLAALLPDDHPVITGTRTGWAGVLAERGALDAAEDQLRAALTARRREFGDDDPRVLDVRYSMADLKFRQGNYTAALRDNEVLLRQCLRLFRPKDEWVFYVRDNLALALAYLGHFDRAEAECRAALAGFTETSGTEHPATLMARTRLAFIMASKGDLHSAEREYVAVLRDLKRVRGAQHPRTREARKNLARVREMLAGQGDLT
jgi:tetratricopeptide (TPR) repeat protein